MYKRVRVKIAAVLVLSLAGLSVAWAQPNWQDLSPEQQAQFSRFAQSWDQLPDQRKTQIIKNHERWKNMSSEERKQARDKYAQLRSLSPEQRDELRRCYKKKRAGEDIKCVKPGED
jgi:hypothetical protein